MPSVEGLDDVHQLLLHGTIEVEGRLVNASNVTLFGSVELAGMSANVVYKPVAGEKALWDFPDGTLAGREVATYLLSQATGLGNIPLTVLRDGPLGPGMVQLWLETTEEAAVDVFAATEVPPDWLVVFHAEDQAGEPVVLAHADHPEIRELALLDVIVNNTDRKGGHLLTTKDGAIYGIDHGVCFHTESKLRTVLWGWIGQPISEESLGKIAELPQLLAGELGETLAQYLTTAEIQSTVERARALLDTRVFPEPREQGTAIPWPLF